MENIRIIETGIDVSAILRQLKKYNSDWGSQKNISNKGTTDGLVTVDVLQMIIGGVTRPGEHVGNTELCKPTPAFFRHTEILKFVNSRCHALKRCAFFNLPVGASVPKHIDEGTYYLTKDRYHLSLQGTYEYSVGDETAIIEPGTFFWFNNKLPHGTLNIGDVPRINFVFDVPHNPRNP